MKMVRLDYAIDSSKIADIVNELDILRKISGDYLVKAAFSFTKGSAHFFFLEYMAGGDLATLLDREVYLSESIARFYVAEIVLALEHLHFLGIIHRDLKPQNLVLDSEGHLKLTDFGLSKASIDAMIQHQAALHRGSAEASCWESCAFGKKKNLLEQPSRIRGHIIGTPDYIPPEILSKTSSENFTIDWWSLGVIVYEMLIGERPFGSPTVEGVFENILGLRVAWPPIGYQEGMVTPEAHDLITRLLEPNPLRRLGAAGASEVKQHPFFAGVDWSRIRGMKPPLQVGAKNVSCAEDPELRAEVDSVVSASVDQSRLKDLRMDNLFRSDLLSEVTIRSGGRKVPSVLLSKARWPCSTSWP